MFINYLDPSLEALSGNFALDVSTEDHWDDINFSLEAANSTFGELKKTYDYHSTIEFDKNLCLDIIDYDRKFVNKNQDHVNFFGSPLLGVYPAKWTESDRNDWLERIIEMDEIGLQSDIEKLKCIDTSHKVSSDVVNLSFIWVAHNLTEAFTSGKIKDRRLYEQAYRSVFAIMHYKFITSLMSKYFGYPADRAVALAAYDALSDKFDIKRAGSWKALIDMRTESLLSRNNIHYVTIKDLKNDESIKYVVTDIQTRIRSVAKSYTKVFYQVKDSNGKILSSSSTLDTEDGHIVKDVSREVGSARSYLNKVIRDRNSFFKMELLGIILRANPSASPDRVSDIIDYISRNSGKTDVKELIDKLIIYLFDMIRVKRLKTGHIDLILKNFRSMMVGSTVTDQRVLDIRKLGDRVASKGANYPTTAAVSPDRTTVLMYIIARLLTKESFK